MPSPKTFYALASATGNVSKDRAAKNNSKKAKAVNNAVENNDKVIEDVTIKDTTTNGSVNSSMSKDEKKKIKKAASKLRNQNNKVKKEQANQVSEKAKAGELTARAVPVFSKATFAIAIDNTATISKAISSSVGVGNQNSPDNNVLALYSATLPVPATVNNPAPNSDVSVQKSTASAKDTEAASTSQDNEDGVLTTSSGEDGESSLSLRLEKLKDEKSREGVVKAEDRIRKRKRKNQNRLNLDESAKNDHSKGDDLHKLMARHYDTNPECRATMDIAQKIHGINVPERRSSQSRSYPLSSPSPPSLPSRPVTLTSPRLCPSQSTTAIESMYVPLLGTSFSLLEENDASDGAITVSGNDDEQDVEEVIVSAPACVAVDKAADEVIIKDITASLPIVQPADGTIGKTEDNINIAEDDVSPAKDIPNDAANSEADSMVCDQQSEDKAKDIEQILEESAPLRRLRPNTTDWSQRPSRAERRAAKPTKMLTNLHLSTVSVAPEESPTSRNTDTDTEDEPEVERPHMTTNQLPQDRPSNQAAKAIKEKAKEDEEKLAKRLATKAKKQVARQAEQLAAIAEKIKKQEKKAAEKAVKQAALQLTEVATIPLPNGSSSDELSVIPSVEQDISIEDKLAAPPSEVVLGDVPIPDATSSVELHNTPTVAQDTAIVDELVTVTPTTETVISDKLLEISANAGAAINSGLSTSADVSIIVEDDVPAAVEVVKDTSLASFFALPNGTGEDISIHQLHQYLVTLHVAPFVEPLRQQSKMSWKDKKTLKQAATDTSQVNEIFVDEPALVDCNLERPFLEGPEDALAAVEIVKDNSLASFFALPNGSGEDIAMRQLREDMVALHVPALVELPRKLTKKEKKTMKHAAAPTSLVDEPLVDEPAFEDLLIEEPVSEQPILDAPTLKEPVIEELTSAKPPQKAIVISNEDTAPKQELKAVDDNNPSSSDEEAARRPIFKLGDRSRRSSSGSKFSSASSASSAKIERRAFSARLTFIGITSLEDFLVELEFDTTKGTATKDDVCEAFATCSAKESEFFEGHNTTTIHYDFASLSAQRKIKLGSKSLYAFLRSIPFDDESVTSTTAILKAFRSAATSNDAPADKLARALEIESESDASI